VLRYTIHDDAATWRMNVNLFITNKSILRLCLLDCLEIWNSVLFVRHRETDGGEVNQEASEQNEVDVIKKGADSTGKVLHI